MKKVRVAELSGPALDWVVAKCEQWITGDIIHPKFCLWWKEQIRTPAIYPSTDWAQGGPIIEREGITLRTNACVSGHWAAFIDFGSSNTNIKARQPGPTPLIAAMRCYVANKLGSEIEIPKELL